LDDLSDFLRNYPSVTIAYDHSDSGADDNESFSGCQYVPLVVPHHHDHQSSSSIIGDKSDDFHVKEKKKSKITIIQFVVMSLYRSSGKSHF
jgi:hypothetical protein